MWGTLYSPAQQTRYIVYTSSTQIASERSKCLEALLSELAKPHITLAVMKTKFAKAFFYNN